MIVRNRDVMLLGGSRIRTQIDGITDVFYKVGYTETSPLAV